MLIIALSCFSAMEVISSVSELTQFICSKCFFKMMISVGKYMSEIIIKKI